MKRLKLALVGVAALLLTIAAPVGAITYGEPDAGEHPYVGFMLFFDPTEPGWFSCSGTLLDETTFLTAGHCAFNIGTDGESAGSSGGNDVWVAFTENVDLSTFPARADFPDDEEGLYLARSAWLNANPLFTQGAAFPHPDYDNFAQFPVNFDVGVVELDGSPGVTSFAVLAPLGTIDAMAASARDRNNALVETVGYGIQSIQPKPMDEESRYKSTSRIVEVNGNQAGAGNVHTLNNPSPIGGRGGSCFGDSGGPLLVNNTNQVVAVVSYGFSLTCHGADYGWRVDTESSQDFILPFVGH